MRSYIFGLMLLGIALATPIDTETCGDEFAIKRVGDDICSCNNNKWECSYHGPPCKEGETKKADCNSCFCANGELGIWACTLVGCHNIALSTSTAKSITKRETDTETCGDGFMMKRVGDDICSCNNNKWECSYYGPACKEGETKKEDCNSCFCAGGDLGIWGCTLMACPDTTLPILNEKSVTKRETDTETCDEFSTKIEGEDMCTCKNNKWECSYYGPPCKEGEIKPLDCNHCVCSGGMWICTLKGCHTMTLPIENEKSITKRETDTETCGDRFMMKRVGDDICSCNNNKWECSYYGPACKEGENKQEDCNSCFCAGGDLAIWGCTLMACPDTTLILNEKSITKRETGETCESHEIYETRGDQVCECRDHKWHCRDAVQSHADMANSKWWTITGVLLLARLGYGILH